MAKNMKSVTARKGEDNTIRIGKDVVLNAERAARREAAIAAGQHRQTGAGAHGGSDQQRNRRDRKKSKQGLQRRMRDSGGREFD